MHTPSEQSTPGPPEGESGAADGKSVPFSQLLAAVASESDRAAFADLFAHYGPKVKTLALRMGADASAAEEIVQETFLAVWRGAKTYDPAQAAASTWIYAIARNAVVDRRRKQRRPELRPCDLTFDLAEDPHTDLRIDRERVAGRLRLALARLPNDQADVLRTFYFEGKSHGRIAEELDLPLGTVKSRIRLALGRLRSALHGEAP